MIGKTLGHYRITSQLGKGGMGEVYAADDLNLNRKVALKFLRDAFTDDAERMARFEREARLLASLNHPNIAAIYGLEQAEGKRFIVMELVEGETLAQRIGKGALPFDEALAICRQIAEGLEAAHEKGVIHRDLKPANVMITEGDKVKILDFGLAKALSDETQAVDSSQSPTLTEAMTRPGVILGTAAYMSPEQAKGKSVDKRADIWAFGCILYECLTGKRAFEGETVTETLAAVLTKEPEWGKIPSKVLPLVRRCLERDPKKRVRDIAEAMEWIEITPESAPVKRPWLAWGIAALAVLIAMAVAAGRFSQKPSASEMVQLQIALPEKVVVTPTGAFAVSPDGRHLAFSGIGPDGATRLWVRAMNSLEAKPLPGTDHKILASIFWSPDSRHIAFDAGGKLKKVNISGEPPETICDLPWQALGGSWNRDGVIIFGTTMGSLMRVSEKERKALPLTRINRTLGESQHACPTFLPDGKHFLYYRDAIASAKQGVYAGSLDAKPEEQSIELLLPGDFYPLYVPPRDSGPGQLFTLREQTLYVQPFDDKGLEPVGESVPAADNVGSYSAFGFFSASSNGVLVYKSGSTRGLSRATWFDRQGNVIGTAGEPATFWGLTLKPDGTMAAMLWQNPRFIDIWLYDFSRGINKPFSSGDGIYLGAVWSPDGSRIIFSLGEEHGDGLYQMSSSGSGERVVLLKSGICVPTSWSSDGRFLLYATAVDRDANNFDVMVLPLEGDRKPIPFVQTKHSELDGHFSPDMRWVAYQSDVSGRHEIYVRRLSKDTGKPSAEAWEPWQVSSDGGMGPRWGREGKELYYRAPNGKVMVVDVVVGPTFQTGTPKPLFQPPPDLSEMGALYSTPVWDVASDGNRFLIPAPVAESSSAPFNVIINWTSLLKK